MKRYGPRARRLDVALCIVALAGVWPRIVHAHVAPSLDENNRYLRITPMRDRIRLAYTVYIGERPGAQVRQRMDSDRDGELDESESAVYRDELAEQVQRALDIALDGSPYQLIWAETYVGLGVPVTDAGSFSVDLIGWICGRDETEHTLRFIDRYRVPLPGESELKVNESPGIEIVRSSVDGTAGASLLDIKWRGEGGPLATSGLHLVYRVDQSVAEIPPGGTCDPRGGAARDPSPPRNWLALLALAGLGLFGLAALALWRLRARRVPDPSHQDTRGQKASDQNENG